MFLQTSDSVGGTMGERLRIWWNGSIPREVKLDSLAFMIGLMFYILIVPACLEMITWVRCNDYSVFMYSVQPEIIQRNEWTLGIIIQNIGMFVFWVIVHELRYEMYLHGDFDTRYGLTGHQRVKLFISIAIWGALSTVTMICLWREWWLEALVWLVVAIIAYYVKKVLIG
jgi:hypothetical protein